MNKKKILITYATYGSGHKTVANHIYNYLKEKSNYEIKIIDVMDYANIIGRLSKETHEKNATHKSRAFIFNMAYKFFDFKATTSIYKIVTKSIFKNKKLQEDIINYNPDLLISTHFWGNIIIGMLNKKGLLDTQIISIMTDYVSHEMWLKDEESVDAYIVSNDIVKKELIEKGVNGKKIYSFGIPISKEFLKVDNSIEIKNKYHVNNNKKTILFFAGGSLGSVTSFNYLKRVLENEYDINIIFVCGKNEELKEKTDNYIKRNKYKNVTVLGFSNEVNNLLKIADVVITKPGGLSITECLEMKKPMLLIPGIGGQEVYNERFVCRNGYGLRCRTPRRLSKTIGLILKKENILNHIKTKLSRYDDNRSIEKIYKLSEKMLKNK